MREFLVGAETRSLAQLRDTPVVRAKLQQVFGLINSTRGDYTAATAALTDALAAERRLLGPDHPDALDSLHALGDVRHDAGDDRTARTLLQESLDRHRRVYGPNHEKTARALFVLAPVVAADNLPRAAGGMLEEALAIRRRVLPPGDPAIAGNLAALGEYHRRIGKFDRGRAFYREALALSRDSGDAYSTRYVGLMNDYRVVSRRNRRLPEAERCSARRLRSGARSSATAACRSPTCSTTSGSRFSFLGRWPDAETSIP